MVKCRTTLTRYLVVFGLAAFPCREASAQVNVEVLRSDLKDAGFGTKIDASLSSFVGNTQGTTMGGGALIGFSTGRHLMYASANGNYSHLGGATQVSNAFAHVRYNLRFSSWLLGELFGQVETDRFRRIVLRDLVGIGPRFEFLDTDSLSLHYGMAYMLEHTRLRPGTEPVPGRPTVVHRFSNYASIVASLDEDRLTLSQTFYYQPRFDEFEDYRLLSIIGFDCDLSGPFTAGINATFRFEQPTPEDVKRADFTLQNTFGIEY